MESGKCLSATVNRDYNPAMIIIEKIMTFRLKLSRGIVNAAGIFNKYTDTFTINDFYYYYKLHGKSGYTFLCKRIIRDTLNDKNYYSIQEWRIKAPVIVVAS